MVRKVSEGQGEKEEGRGIHLMGPDFGEKIINSSEYAPDCYVDRNAKAAPPLSVSAQEFVSVEMQTYAISVREIGPKEKVGDKMKQMWPVVLFEDIYEFEDLLDQRISVFCFIPMI